MNAYAVLSIGDLKHMLRAAKKDQSTVESMARHKAAGRNPDITCTVWYAPLTTIKGKPTKQLGTFSMKAPVDE